MSMSFKASPDGTFGEILVNGQVVAKLPVTGNAVIPGLVGTVSQSGGVPTGAVVERGSNANGEYVRFADGTQICTSKVTLTADAIRYFALHTWPAGFVSAAYAVSVSPDISSANWSAVADRPKLGVQGAYNMSATQATIGIEEIAGQSITGSATLDNTMVVAVGRWF